MITESQNLSSRGIDRMSVPDILRLMNENDKMVALAVEKTLPEIAKAVELAVKALKHGGRMFYVGAGTSGRLGVADAAECPPTYGVDPETVQAMIAGGRTAVFKSKEGAEDNEKMGGRDLTRRKISAKDLVVGLSASARTPYVCGALRKAKSVGASTVAIVNNSEGSVAKLADVVICPIVGPEVIMGSTRLKAGSACKMVLNMISTTTMIRLGRVRGNLMVNMQLSCGKLRERACRMLAIESGIDENTASDILSRHNYDFQKALASLKKNKKHKE